MASKKRAPVLTYIIIGTVAVSLLVIAVKSRQIQNIVSSPSPVSNLTLQPPPKESTLSALPTVDRLQKYLTVEAAFLGVSDNISLYFKDLNGTREVGIDPVRSWIPASTIKSFVILEAFRQRRLGIINFDDKVTITANNVVPTELETDNFPKLREGTVATISQLVGAMIDQSDNTAYNTLLDVLDRRNINQTLRDLGITETVVGQKLNLDDNQTLIDEQALGYQLNTTTAKDLATFFNLLYDKKIPNSDEILDIFKKQKINNMIPAFLPQNTAVAHKTGDLAPIYHDGGIIYKQNDPFLLSIFTNSNDPTIVAKLAQVAYFQNADVIGKLQAQIPIRSYLAESNEDKTVESLAQDQNQRVLAASDNSSSFPNITAADLGITSQDLNPEKIAAQNIGAAIFTPGTIFYDIKTFIEDTRLKLAQNNNQKITVNLDIAKNRLSEVKATAQSGDILTTAALMAQSENDMKKSIDISTNGKPNDMNLLKIKQVNDLSFATLAEVAPKVPAAQKEAFVDMAYNFYTQNQKEIKPVIQKSLAKTSTQQEPIIGTVDKVSGNTITVKFDDGSTKNVVTNNTVPNRQFDSTKTETQNPPQEGTRIAIVGQTTASGQIIPTFVLKNLPKAFPDKKTGTVIQVNPGNNTIQIKDNSGKTQEVKIGDDTIVKSKDTNVSVEGIKPGSQVTVFGTPNQNVPSGNGTPTTAAPAQSRPANTTQSKPAQSAPPINANTVTVTKNAPGKQEEKKAEQKSQSQSQSHSNPAPAPSAPAPKSESPKTEGKPKSK